MKKSTSQINYKGKVFKVNFDSTDDSEKTNIPKKKNRK